MIPLRNPQVRMRSASLSEEHRPTSYGKTVSAEHVSQRVEGDAGLACHSTSGEVDVEHAVHS